MWAQAHYSAMFIIYSNQGSQTEPSSHLGDGVNSIYTRELSALGSVGGDN